MNFTNSPLKTDFQNYRLANKTYLVMTFFSLSYVVLDYFAGIYYSALAAVLSIIGYLISMYVLYYPKKFETATYIIYLSIGLSVIIVNYVEGLMAGSIWFLLNLFFASPFFIRREKNYKKHIKKLYLLSASMIVISLIISPKYSTIYPHITMEQTHYKFIYNSIVCFIILLFFSIFALKSDANYIKKVDIARSKAEDEKERRTKVLSTVSHELRTQINSVNSITQLFLDNKDLQVEQKEQIETLNYCNDNMLVLVNDLLDIYKIEMGGFQLFKEPVSTKIILSRAILPFVAKAKEKSILLRNEIDDELINDSVTINTDRSRLIQVIDNLISNAIKFTNHGEIIFSASIVQETEENIDIKFSVKDTGVGINSRDTDKIFDSFSQIKNENDPNVHRGTGLGLSISKSIIDKMGGVLEVSSVINEGSIFHFQISFEKINPQSIKSKRDDYSNQLLKGVTILIAEDNKISMLYANKLLNSYGARTYTAENGAEAVEIVSSKNDIDLVLLDLEMPVMNGFIAIEKIKEIHNGLSVIAFTANIPSDSLLKELQISGFDDIISKPYKKNQMLDILNRFVLHKR